MKKSATRKFYDLKVAEFCVICGAEKSVRLTPAGDDKPHSAEIPHLKAGSDTPSQLKLARVEPVTPAKQNFV